MIKKIMVLCLIGINIFADGNNLSRPDGHAPIGVMGDHTHITDKKMISYRIMSMSMSKFFNGSSEISLDSVKASYTMIPTSMQMTMHMIGGMWGISNDITLTAMGGYSLNSMDMLQMNQSSTMTSSGLNDLKISTLINISKKESETIIGQFGVSIPLGSIEEKNASGTHLPYGMQLGSGTYDLIMGVTSTYFLDNTSFGAQVNGIIRTGKNKLDYHRGHQFQTTIWGQTLVTDDISSSIRSTITINNNIEGKDNTLSTMTINMNPAYNTNQGQIVADIAIGTNYKPKSLKKTRFATELIIPVYRKSNAISLMSENNIIFGIQHAL